MTTVTTATTVYYAQSDAVLSGLLYNSNIPGNSDVALPGRRGGLIYVRGNWSTERQGHIPRVTQQKVTELGASLAVQGLRLGASTAGGTGSIRSLGTKIPQASWHGKTI